MIQHILITYVQIVLCGSVFLIRIHKHTPSNKLVMKRGKVALKKQASHFTQRNNKTPMYFVEDVGNSNIQVFFFNFISQS